MALQITLASGEVVTIPPRLAAALETPVGAELPDYAAVSLFERTANPLKLAQELDHPDRAAGVARNAAILYTKQNEPDLAIVSLSIYAQLLAYNYRQLGDVQSSLAALADALTLVHGVLPCCGIEATRQLTQLLSKMTEDALSWCASFDAFEVFRTAKELTIILTISSVVWGPELEPELSALQALLPSIRAVAGEEMEAYQQRTLVEHLTEDLTVLRTQAASKSTRRMRTQERLQLVQQLIDAWLAALKSKLVLPVVRAPEGWAKAPSDSLMSEVQMRIAEVERRSRLLISRRYEQQFGLGWIQHVAAKHSNMYQNWLQNMQRDRTAFKAYKDYSPEILEYARFEDLSELVSAQWHLFRETFDFGYEDRNKAAYNDVMKQIARVRNPLAHHRSIPENELLRAKVLCTDLLNLLDKVDGATCAS